MDQEVADLAEVADAATDQQGVGEPVGGRFAGQGEGEERPVVVPLTLGPVPARAALPPGGPTEQVIDPFHLLLPADGGHPGQRLGRGHRQHVPAGALGAPVADHPAG
jgi:hypothetical protein